MRVPREHTVMDQMSTRGRSIVIATVAPLVALMLILGLPLEAQAATIQYFGGNATNGTWFSIGTPSSTGQQANAQFSAATVTVTNGQTSASGSVGVTQTYTRRSVELSCRWYNTSWPGSTSVPLYCSYFS